MKAPDVDMVDVARSMTLTVRLKFYRQMIVRIWLVNALLRLVRFVWPGETVWILEERMEPNYNRDAENLLRELAEKERNQEGPSDYSSGDC